MPVWISRPGQPASPDYSGGRCSLTVIVYWTPQTVMTADLGCAGANHPLTPNAFAGMSGSQELGINDVVPGVADMDRAATAS